MEKYFDRLQNAILKCGDEKADAIIWLQGDRYDRGPKTLALYKNGLAPKIVISGNNVLIGLGPRPGENNINLKQMENWLLKRMVKKDDIIIDSSSFNTRDQSLNVTRLAKLNKWKKIIIVGSFPHYQARYFLTFIKGAIETKWNGSILNAFVIIPNNKKPGGRSQTAISILNQEYKKINKYKRKGHLVNLKMGINYLLNK